MNLLTGKTKKLLINIQALPLCLLLSVTTLCLLSKKVCAQPSISNLKVQGVIVDSASNKPLPLVTIRLKADTGSTSKTLITQSDGSFVFTVAGLQKYFIVITAIGYREKQVTIDATDSNTQTKNLGTIAISNRAGALQNVVVTASKPLVRQEADKIIYDLQADPDSKSNSVWEMMRKVPFLSVDGQNNILLKGSSSYRIFINGKPSGMVERNPRDVLRSIPASTIVSIEVITTPSSKYDAEGLAGIINIITMKKIDNGYNGTLNVNYKSPVGGPGLGGYFAYKRGKFGMSVLGGGSLYNTPATINNGNRKATGNTSSNLDQNGNAKSNSRNTYLGTEFSYEIDSLKLLSLQFNINKSSGTGFNRQQALLTEMGTIVQQYAIENNNKSNGTGIDLGLNYQLGFRKNKNQLLTFSYRYLANQNYQFATLDLFNFINYPFVDYQQANEGNATEHTFQVDYVQLIKKLTMEAGTKAIIRKNNSDFQYLLFDSSKNRFEPDVSRSNNYNNNQYILSAYNTYQWAIKNWNIKVGVRLEQTIIDADFVSTASQVQEHYFSVVPAVVISKKLSKISNLSISYTNRIQRPGINQLNPFIDRSNPSFETTGNPELRPAYTNVFQVSYIQSQKATINIALGCMLFNNLISRFASYDSATDITRTSFRNIGATRIYKTNLYFNYPITKSWSVRLNSDIRYITATINTGKTILNNNGWSTYVNTSTSYRLGATWRLNADVTLNSATITGVQSTINGFVGFNTNVQKDLAKGKLTLAASISNPFSKFRYSREELGSIDFIQVNTNQLYYRLFGLSLNYRFGKLKDAIKKNKRGITNDDAAE
jgi:ferric enterobactin receptor